MLVTLVPLALLLWLAYAAYFLAVYGGQIACRWRDCAGACGLLRGGVRAAHAAPALGGHVPRSHTGRPCHQPEALANSGVPLAYRCWAGAVPVVLHAYPAPLAASRYLAADASILALIVSNLSVSPVLAGLRPRARLAWAGAVCAFLAAEMAVCLRWEAAHVVVLAVNVAVLVAFCSGARGWNPPYRVVPPGPLAAQGAGTRACRSAVYAREFLFTPGGLLSCAAGYGFALRRRPTSRHPACRPPVAGKSARLPGDRRRFRRVPDRSECPPHRLLQADAGFLWAADRVHGVTASGRAGANHPGSVGPGADGPRRAVNARHATAADDRAAGWPGWSRYATSPQPAAHPVLWAAGRPLLFAGLCVAVSWFLYRRASAAIWRPRRTR